MTAIAQVPEIEKKRSVRFAFPASYDVSEFLELILTHNVDPTLEYSAEPHNTIRISGASSTYIKLLAKKVTDQLCLIQQTSDKDFVMSSVKKDFFLLGAIDTNYMIMEKFPEKPEDRPGYMYEYVDETLASPYRWLFTLCTEKEIETKYTVNPATMKPEIQFLIEAGACHEEKKAELLDILKKINEFNQDRQPLEFREAAPQTKATASVSRY